MNLGRVAANIDGGKDAPVHRQKMRREADMDGPACEGAEFLIEFAQMAVLATGGIAVRAARQFSMQEVLLERPPCPADACLQVDQDVIQINATL